MKTCPFFMLISSSISNIVTKLLGLKEGEDNELLNKYRIDMNQWVKLVFVQEIIYIILG